MNELLIAMDGKMDEKIKEIIKELKEVRNENVVLKTAHRNLEEKLSKKYQKIIGFLNVFESYENFNDINDRLKVLSYKLQIEIFKILTISELSRFKPSVYPKILILLDYPDKFWEGKGGWTILQWDSFLAGVK